MFFCSDVFSAKDWCDVTMWDDPIGSVSCQSVVLNQTCFFLL